MLVKEKPKSNTLIEYAKQGSYTGTGNYIATTRGKYQPTTNELERIAFPNIFEEVNETNEDSSVTYIVATTGAEKSDLPLTTDLLSNVGYDMPPASLRFARLGGLQYFTRS